MSELTREIRLRVVQQVTLKVPLQDELAAVELAKSAVSTVPQYQVQGQVIPIIDQYVEGILVLSVEERDP